MSQRSARRRQKKREPRDAPLASTTAAPGPLAAPCAPPSLEPRTAPSSCTCRPAVRQRAPPTVAPRTQVLLECLDTSVLSSLITYHTYSHLQPVLKPVLKSCVITHYSNSILPLYSIRDREIPSVRARDSFDILHISAFLGWGLRLLFPSQYFCFPQSSKDSRGSILKWTKTARETYRL